MISVIIYLNPVDAICRSYVTYTMCEILALSPLLSLFIVWSRDKWWSMLFQTAYINSYSITLHTHPYRPIHIRIYMSVCVCVRIS